MVIISGVATPASAALSRLSITAPGGFVQAGVSPVGFGFFLVVGSDFESLYNGVGDDFSEGAFSGLGSITRSAAAVTTNTSGSSMAFATMGQIKLKASSTSPNLGFANGGAHGGFKENFTVSGGVPGAAGWMLVDILVSGSASASGAAGSAGFSIGGFKDGIELRNNNPFWDNGNSDPASTDRQRAKWRVSSFASGTTDSRVVNDMITFAVPITFGVQFSFDIYGFAEAGKRSSGSAPGLSSASVDFFNTITWGGINAILASNGSTISSSSVVGSTGLDWTGVVPAPGALLVFGLGSLVSIRRNRRNEMG